MIHGPLAAHTRIALLVAAWAALSTPTAAAAPAEPWAPPLHAESPYELRLDVDLPVTLAGYAVWVIPFLALKNTVAGPSCDPCDPATLNAFDRLVVGQPASVGRTISDAYFVIPAALAVAGVFDVGVTNWRSWLADLVVINEAVAVGGALAEVVRRAVRRPRPFLYTDGVYPDERPLPEAAFSFYSVHTATAFTLATSLAYTFHLRHPGSRARYLVWTASLLLAAAEGGLRVWGGAHFPTDVIAGALVGTAVGVLVPALHRRRLHLGPVEATVTIAPRPSGALLGLGGSW